MSKCTYALLLFVFLLVPSIGLASAQQGVTANQFGPAAVTADPLTYSLNSTYVANQFGWTSSIISMSIHNPGTTPSAPTNISLAFPAFYYTDLWSYNVSGISSIPVFYRNSTYFNSTLPSIPPGSSLNITVGMKFYGLITPTGGETYVLPITPVPLVTLPHSSVTNATLYFSLPAGVQVSNLVSLLSENFTQVAGATPTFRYSYTNLTNVSPFPVNVQLNSTSTANFAVFRVANINRVLSYGQDGSVWVTDEVTIFNNDSVELTSIELTAPATGSYLLSQGLIHATTYHLTTGVVNLPSPIPYQGQSVVDITYQLNRSAVSQVGNGLQVNLGKYCLSYPAFVGDYHVSASLPKGSTVDFLSGTSYINVTSIPSVSVDIHVPSDYLLRPALPVALVALVIAILVYAVYAYTGRTGPEGEVDTVVEQKRRIVLGLLEDIRLRGEGFTPYAYFTDERKEFENERNRLNAKINDLRNKAKKDKAYRGPVDRLASEDGKLEQAYKEAKQALEEKLSGALSEKNFTEKIRSLRAGLESSKKAGAGNS